jgi:predicted ATPase
MYVHSAKLVNYKSIGDYAESEVIIEPRVTAIIGKNESGKSNILDGLSQINFRKRKASAFANATANRSCGDGKQIKYVLLLKPSAEDVTLGITEESTIEITHSTMTVSGGLLSYYESTIAEAVTAVAKMLDLMGGGNPLKLSSHDLPHYQLHKAELASKDTLDLLHKFVSLQYMVDHRSSIPAASQKAFKDTTDNAANHLYHILGLLPQFYFRDSGKNLRTVYKLEDVQKELADGAKGQSSLLYDFVNLIEIQQEDFILAVQNGNEGRQTSIRSRIKRQIDRKINDDFRAFYTTEDVTLSVDFNANSVTFSVQTGEGETLQLGERSNGLRWYLETFIDAKANNLPQRNVVYLFDEPGCFLHVNAQKELVSLFGHLADQGNQVVYTTHSPYMLDTEKDGIHRIRAVVKDPQGFTHIYKTAYDNKISPDSVHDTLAPIVNALGMNMNDTFGPAKNKINIVTEGISDYIYMCMMGKLLDIDAEKYAIIPSQGASKCVDICAILHGWGCKYIAVFDYDKAGVESGAEIMRNQLIYDLNKDYCFMNEVTQEDIDAKTYRTSAFMVEDLITREEINRFCEEMSISPGLKKALIAKKMSNAIDAGEFTLNDTAIANFRALFERILSYI